MTEALAPTMPRLPIFGWQALQGGQHTAMPCLADLPGARFTTSGRASILLALQCLGVGRNDAVLLPTYHCPTMVAPAVSLQATPIFYPIDGQGRPDLAWLERQDLHAARVLLVPHYFGLPQPMQALRRWCDERGIALLEDCAHALFGRAGERAVGAWGDIAIASLTKFLPVPEGGCIVLNRDTSAFPALTPGPPMSQARALLDILELGARHGRLTGLNTLIAGGLALARRVRSHPAAHAAVDHSPFDPKRDGAAPSDFVVDSAAAGRELTVACRWVASRLPRERVVLRRRQNFELLQRLLAGQTGFRPLVDTLPPDCAPYVFPLWVDEPDPGYVELRRLQLPVFRWDRVWPGLPEVVGDHGPTWSHHVLQLGCHQDLNDADLGNFASTLQRLYARPTATR